MNILDRLEWLSKHPEVREIIIDIDEAKEILELVGKTEDGTRNVG